MKRWVADAPVRADLAGGTLDLWPLGLFHPGAVTVAVAVSLRVTAAVIRLGGRRASVRADDLQIERTIDLDRASIRRDRLELLERVLRAVAPRGGVQLTTRSPVRAGSGLGTSSVLGVASVAALQRALGSRASSAQAVALVRDLEAQILGIPTGTQDHLAGWHGGVVIVEHRPGGGVVRRLTGPVLDRLGERLILVDSVQGRSSGPSNWDMFQRRVGGDPTAIKALDQVGRAGRAAAAALAPPDWRALGRAMRADLDARCNWSPLVMTPAFEQIFTTALAAGAFGAKVCGAGGGGFGVVLAPPERRGRVEAAIREAGGQPSPARPTGRGLRVQAIR